MAVLIRSIRTGRFYGGFNDWPLDPKKAFDFRKLKIARRWISTVNLGEVEIIRDYKTRTKNCFKLEFHTLTSGPRLKRKPLLFFSSDGMSSDLVARCSDALRKTRLLLRERDALIAENKRLRLRASQLLGEELDETLLKLSVRCQAILNQVRAPRGLSLASCRG